LNIDSQPAIRWNGPDPGIPGPVGREDAIVSAKASQGTPLRDDDQIGAPTRSVELANATRSIVGGVLSGQFGATPNWAGLYPITCSESEILVRA
jgi:hypothetical protein